jgi:hypothetical protein
MGPELRERAMSIVASRSTLYDGPDQLVWVTGVAGIHRV